jgi:hypothetical protein
MLKIQDAVERILFSDEEALSAISRGFINLSGYAALIKTEVEDQTKKEVQLPSIVVALSRLQRKVRQAHPMIVDVRINSISTKSPVTELVYEKKDALIKKVASLYQSLSATMDDFLNITISSNEIGIICSDRILKEVQDHLGEKPQAQVGGLAILSLAIDPEQYDKPNITYSLIRRIALKRIVLAEAISTYGEIIFVFQHKDLSEMLELFSS